MNRTYKQLLLSLVALVSICAFSASSFAQSAPSLPRSGVKGAFGIGVANFDIIAPKGDFEMSRGTYVAGTIEHPINFANLSLALSISQMTADGKANYRYQGSSVAYSTNGLGFSANLYDVALGLKFKFLENSWFRPYVGAGGLGGYHTLTYSSSSALSSQGSDYKNKESAMGGGYYGEGGLELQFAQRFGVLLAARLSDYTSKPFDTLGSKRIHYRSETYIFSALVGF